MTTHPRPTWFDATAIHSLEDLKGYTIHLLLLRDGDDTICIYPVSSTTGISSLSRGSPLTVNVRSATPDAGKAAVIIVRGTTKDAASLPAVAVTAARKWLFGMTAQRERPRRSRCGPP
jgi:hypothetical protein